LRRDAGDKEFQRGKEGKEGKEGKKGKKGKEAMAKRIQCTLVGLRL
jgi:hypothetical protein